MSVITVINSIEVPQGKEQEILDKLKLFSDYFSQQKGYIKSELHKAIDPNSTYPLVNISIWQSSEDFETALNQESFKQVAKKAGDFTSHPRIYQTQGAT